MHTRITFIWAKARSLRGRWLTSSVLSMALIVLSSVSAWAQTEAAYLAGELSDTLVLEASVAHARAVRSSQSGDTLIYNAGAYKTVMGASSEDLIAKMPGIAVNSRSVEANGRKVTRVMVDGKEFFADDVMTALRNVPADIISEIEVVNKLSDEGELSQMDDGDSNAALNIVTKKRKNHESGGTLTGRVYGGYGLTTKYIAGGSVNWFGEKNSATVMAMANNISRYNFVSDDLVSASSSSVDGAGKDFSVQPLPGLSSVQSVGANYSNDWFSGSYLFNRIDNANESEALRRRMLADGRYQVNGNEDDFEALNMVHRLSAKMNWRKGGHSVIFRPSFSWQDLNGDRSQNVRVHREGLATIDSKSLDDRFLDDVAMDYVPVSVGMYEPYCTGFLGGGYDELGNYLGTRLLDDRYYNGLGSGTNNVIGDNVGGPRYIGNRLIGNAKSLASGTEAEEFLYNRVVSRQDGRKVLKTGGRLTYGYRFDKKGRNLTATVFGNYFQNRSGEDVANWTIKQEENGFDIDKATSNSFLNRNRNVYNYDVGTNLSYTEPLSRRSRIAVDYQISYRRDWTDNQTFVGVPTAVSSGVGLGLDSGVGYGSDGRSMVGRGSDGINNGMTLDPRQSASNANGFLTNVVGLRYNFRLRQISITAKLAFQHVDYNGHSTIPSNSENADNPGHTDHPDNTTKGGSIQRPGVVKRHFNDVVYNVIAKVPFDTENTLRVDARGWTRNPNVAMMQDVVNLNNLSYIRAGNPRIRPSYTHRVYTRYLHTNRSLGSTISLSLNCEGSANYIGDSLVVDSPDFQVTEGVYLGDGNQFSKPVNLPGHYNISTVFTYGFPISALSSNFNINAAGTWSAVPGMINGSKVPVHRDRYSLRLKLDSNVSELLDFSLSYDVGYSINEYVNAYGKMRNNFVVQNGRGRVKWIFWKGLTLSGAAHWEHHWNVDKLYNDHRVYCDLFLGIRLFKDQMGEISIGCNDIFNHSAKVFRHNITASGSTDIVNQGIGRYFSIQFVYHFRKY